MVESGVRHEGLGAEKLTAAETALVWAEGGVELNTVALVDLWLQVVVLPNNTELDDALWDGNDLEGGLVLWVLLEEGGVLEGGCELCECVRRKHYYEVAIQAYRCRPAQTLARRLG